MDTHPGLLFGMLFPGRKHMVLNRISQYWAEGLEADRQDKLIIICSGKQHSLWKECRESYGNREEETIGGGKRGTTSSPESSLDWDILKSRWGPQTYFKHMSKPQVALDHRPIPSWFLFSHLATVQVGVCRPRSRSPQKTVDNWFKIWKLKLAELKVYPRS